MQGWISLHRKILENPVVCKDAEYFSVWCYLLLNATHSEYDTMFYKKRVTLMKGQLITSRKSISTKFNISESKVQRILKTLEIEQQIEQQTTSVNRLISILNWESYQNSEQPIEQRVNNEWTTSEQRVNTNNNINNGNTEKNVRNDYESVYEYYNSLNLKKHRAYTNDMSNSISSAMKNNKYTEEYCKILLDRHKKIVDITKNSEHPVTIRTLTEFFGQKAFNAKHLICSEYEEGGKLYEKYLNESNIKPTSNNGFMDLTDL